MGGSEDNGAGGRAGAKPPVVSRRAAIASAAYGAAALAGTKAYPQAAASKRGGGKGLPPIIDVHSHPGMPAFVQALRDNSGGRPYIPEFLTDMPCADWRTEQYIELMDEHGIAASVMSNPLGMAGQTGEGAVALCRRVNDEMAEVIARYPRRFGAFAMLPLHDLDASLIELRRALDDLKFDGVCLLTDVDGVYFGDKRYAPLFSELNRRKSAAFVHPVVPGYHAAMAPTLPLEPGLMEFMIDSNRAAASFILSGMQAAYPAFTYIAAHGGGTTPYLVHRFETGQRTVKGYNVPMTPEQIRAGFASLHYELTTATGPEQLAAITQLVPTSQLMMGFDFPLRPARLIEPARSELAQTKVFTAKDRHLVARENALRLLPRLGSRLMA